VERVVLNALANKRAGGAKLVAGSAAFRRKILRLRRLVLAWVRSRTGILGEAEPPLSAWWNQKVEGNAFPLPATSHL